MFTIHMFIFLPFFNIVPGIKIREQNVTEVKGLLTDMAEFAQKGNVLPY